jgi:hypothetical protein
MGSRSSDSFSTAVRYCCRAALAVSRLSGGEIPHHGGIITS